LTQRRREWALLTLAGSAFLCGQILMLGHEPLGRYKAGLLHVPAIMAEMTPQTPIYAVRLYEQSLPFYLRHKLILVEFADEMEFGVKQEPQLWLPTRAAFLAQWKADSAKGRKAIAILQPDEYPEMQQLRLPMRIIGQDPRRIIVTNDLNKKTAP
jgi:aminoarabinose transferase-like protein